MMLSGAQGLDQRTFLPIYANFSSDNGAMQAGCDENQLMILHTLDLILCVQFTKAVESKQVAQQDAERARFVVLKADQVCGPAMFTLSWFVSMHLAAEMGAHEMFLLLGQCLLCTKAFHLIIAFCEGLALRGFQRLSSCTMLMRRSG